jgi:uncharacterized protein
VKYFVTLIILTSLGIVGYLYLPAHDTSNITNLYKGEEITDNLTVEIDSPISIKKLRDKKIESDKYVVEQKLANGSNYERFIVSYLSEGEKVFGLLTVPFESKPEKGFPAIIFNHGYIPPSTYSTTSNYAAYVDYLAKNGFVVFKIDMRGHGKSEGLATGSYFSSTYTIDVISALKSLQKSEIVDPKRIGVWGHSMSGNLVLRSMLVNENIKAGVIWAGAVYSYEDFGKYRISDSSYMARPTQQIASNPNRDTNPEIQKLRDDVKNVNFSSDYWKAVSLTQNINFLNNPIQIHHSVDDNVVNVGYSRDLEKVLKENNKNYEYFEYSSGGHNISGFNFNQAMESTVAFFKKNL